MLRPNLLRRTFTLYVRTGNPNGTVRPSRFSDPWFVQIRPIGSRVWRQVQPAGAGFFLGSDFAQHAIACHGDGLGVFVDVEAAQIRFCHLSAKLGLKLGDPRLEPPGESSRVHNEPHGCAAGFQGHYTGRRRSRKRSGLRRQSALRRAVTIRGSVGRRPRQVFDLA